ncbi:hypothetical protein VA7868_00514 [Vibrio aerogenes CECT 7868]|uniref:Uncharacterized protein n=1 Tax=Vibrio aerogenes CECT 7868 TaxID=1216006 RepID=A0A1M5VUW2_9VIBR|nr:hypothetical protein VA7868_00514 [Vibrio aerogenes CECT 7868]
MSDYEYNEDSLELLDAMEIGIDISEVQQLIQETETEHQ